MMSRISPIHGRFLQALSTQPCHRLIGYRRSFWTLKDVNRVEVPKKNEDLTPAELNEKLTSLLRIVPHALTVVTSKADFDTERMGLLVSSFNSVTLQPIPFVSFNIRSGSRTLMAIKKSQHFMASIVDDPFIADAFARKFGGKSDEIMADAMKTDGRLKPDTGGVMWFKCRYVERSSAQVGDHDIVVGEVLDFAAYGGKDLTESTIVYSQGQYRRLDRSQSVELGLSTDGKLEAYRKRWAAPSPVYRRTDWPRIKHIEERKHDE